MQKFTRKELYTIEEVLAYTVPTHTTDKDSRVSFDGDLIKMNSERYELFKEKGVECVFCGVVGEYFAKEKSLNAQSYHFNLYGTDKYGEEVLITKDHIIPKSKGGRNNLDNYQTMCYKCNQEKNNK